MEMAQLKKAVVKLAKMKQSHLLNRWKKLSLPEKLALLAQIESIDSSLLDQQRELLQKVRESSLEETPLEQIEPFLNFAKAGNVDDQKKGWGLIEKGLVGCLLIAGGQGSRLHFDGPKGMFPVSPITKKTLFQMVAEKVAAASKLTKRPLLLGIMTSPLNHAATVDFFQQNRFFGLERNQVDFFSQGMLPILDDEGNLFLETDNKIAFGPDGNGGALREFYKNGLWEKWHRQGVQYLNFILIDNPLADPFDAELIGYHHRKSLDIVIKCIPREDPFEKVGLLATFCNQTIVLEYSEASEIMKTAQNPDGTLVFSCANISLFSFSMEFVRSVGLDFKRKMPLHIAKKSTRWKFERFIFDLLATTNKVEGLLYRREECFAPLKNAFGADSLVTVQEALQRRDKEMFSQVTGETAEEGQIELSQDFYYRKKC